MKNFQDFMASLDSSTVLGIVNDANLKAKQVYEDAAPGEDALSMQIGVVSYTIALELLACYHKWLEPQLPDL